MASIDTFPPNATPPAGVSNVNAGNFQLQRQSPFLMIAVELREFIYQYCEDIFLSPLHDPRYHSHPLDDPQYAVGFGETRPSGWFYSALADELYRDGNQGLTPSERMDLLEEHAAEYLQDTPRTSFNKHSTYPHALLLACKQTHHEAQHTLGRKIAIDFIAFDDAQQCWVRSTSPLMPQPRARELAITFWDIEQPLAPLGLSSSNYLRRLAGIVSDLQAVLQLTTSAPGLITRVDIEVHFGMRSQGVVIDADRGVSSCLDLRLDVNHLFGQFLLRQTALRTLAIGGCDISRVFASEDLQPLLQRGVDVFSLDSIDLDDAEVTQASIADPYDVFDLSDDEPDWEAWEKEFGEGTDVDEVSSGEDDEMGLSSDEERGPAFLYYRNS